MDHVPRQYDDLVTRNWLAAFYLYYRRMKSSNHDFIFWAILKGCQFLATSFYSVLTSLFRHC